MNEDIFTRIAVVLESRKGAEPGSSYVAGLYADGLEKILEKIAEESTETIIAAKEGDKNAIIHETADLWFHTMVMLSHLELGPDQVLEELERRFNISGLQEKASRQN